MALSDNERAFLQDALDNGVSEEEAVGRIKAALARRAPAAPVHVPLPVPP